MDHKKRHTSNPTYSSWTNMRQRCLNPKSPSYRYCGGRGIAVCERWLDFESFLEDMGPRPTGKSLDRYPNNNGHYEPGNCRWTTPSRQSINRRGNINSTSKFKGVSYKKQTGRWTVTVNERHVGYFLSEEDAARAYDREALKLWGEDALLNFK